MLTQRLMLTGNMSEEPDQTITIPSEALAKLANRGELMMKDEVTDRVVKLELEDGEKRKQFTFEPEEGGNMP
jgi:hypothetical protein